MKRMIGVRKQLKRGARAKFLTQRIQQFQVGQLVASSLKEEHRDIKISEMFRTIVRRLARRVERKSEEYQSPNSG